MIGLGKNFSHGHVAIMRSFNLAVWPPDQWRHTVLQLAILSPRTLACRSAPPGPRSWRAPSAPLCQASFEAPPPSQPPTHHYLSINRPVQSSCAKSAGGCRKIGLLFSEENYFVALVFGQCDKTNFLNNPISQRAKECMAHV